MKQINSHGHPFFKQLKLLAKGAGQYRPGQPIVLEGIHLAQAWLMTQGLPDYCLTTESALANLEIVELMTAIPKQRCVLLHETLFRSISYLTQGTSIIFLVMQPKLTIPEQINEDCIILDRIQDPGNVGSILRTSVAAGIKWVFCLTGTAAAWSPKVLRAGMGAQFQLKVIERIEVDTLLAKLTIPMMATIASATTPIYQVALNRPLAWAFGNEGKGLSQALLSIAQSVSIPQSDGIESLNVAAAVAICLFESLRQKNFDIKHTARQFSF